MNKIKKPVLFINFKTYKETTGKNALKLARIAEKIAKKTKKSIVLVVQPTDIRLIAENSSLGIFAQHIDPIVFGSRTGHILPEAVKEAGAVGTFLNHAERKISNEEIKKAVERCRELNLAVLVCAETTERAKEIALFKPDFIAIEPPELIGGDISVSTAKPELISETVKGIHSIADIPVITGAGIKNSEDVRKAIKLGTAGMIVASGIIKTENPEKAILDLLRGFG